MASAQAFLAYSTEAVTDVAKTSADWRAVLFLALLVGGGALSVSKLKNLQLLRTKLASNTNAVLARAWSGRNVFTIFLYMVAGHALFTLVALFLQHISGTKAAISPAGMLAFNAAALPGSLFVAMFLLRKRGCSLQAFSSESLALLPKRVLQGCQHYLIMFPFFILATAVQTYIMFRIGVQPELQEAIQIFQDGATNQELRLLVVIVTVIIAPVTEELLFRGMLFPSAARMLGTKQGVIFSSLLFAFVHFHPHLYLGLFVVGVAMNLSYLATGSLASAIILHAVFNSVSLVFSL